MELDSVEHKASLTKERALSVLNFLNSLKGRIVVPLKLFQKLLRHMAAEAAVRVLRWAWQCGTHRVQITPGCWQTFSPWSDLAFLLAGVPLQKVSRLAVVHMDASATGWGTIYDEMGAVMLVFKKHNGPTLADDIAPQIITHCGNLKLDFKQLEL